MIDRESEDTMQTKRPLRWRIDDALGTRPLADLMLSGPQHGVAEWIRSIAVIVRHLSSPAGHAWMRWRQAAWLGSEREDELYRRSCAISRLERWRRRRAA